MSKEDIWFNRLVKIVVGILCLIVLVPLVYYGTKKTRVVRGYNHVPNIWRNNQAVDMQAQKKMTEAFDEFASLLAKEPFNGLFQYNMGTGFLTIEDIGKAKKMMLKIAEQNDLPPHLAFATNYNLGVLKTMEKDVDGALESYQASLEYQPDSIEVKTNIELLIQQKKGGGGGDGKKKQDENQQGKNDQDQQNKDDQDDQEQQKQPQKFTNQPQPFNGKEMSKQDVRRILEELKNQEQRIRAKHDRKGGKEKDRDKNW